MNNKQFRKEIAKQCGFETEAIQASAAGDWPSVEVQNKHWDEKAEHERDLEHESRVDFASWEVEGQ